MAVVGSLYRIAVGALVANKLRSSLTLIGIIFGVTSVMTIISALEGMMGSIQKEIESLGPATFMVSKSLMITSDEEWREKSKRKPINLRLADLIENHCTLCDKISPRTFWGADIKYGGQRLRDVGIMGGKANFVDIVDFEVAQGRFHSFEDDFYKRRVVFIGEDVREAFFSGVDPMGKEIKVDGERYTVIGVAKKRGEMFGESQDNFVIIPLSTFIRQFGEPRWGLNVVVKAISVEQLPDAMDEVRLILRSARNVPYDKPDDFDMMTADDVLDFLNNITGMFRLVLVAVSAISLIIGGIVVMNIMMVSVTERTREIGIRKSLGARKSHILWQFLFEALTLTMTGGLIGMVAGYLIAKSLTAAIDFDIEPTALAIIAGLAISSGTGLIFGVYPAWKASKLDPVKALSYE